MDPFAEWLVNFVKKDYVVIIVCLLSILFILMYSYNENYREQQLHDAYYSFMQNCSCSCLITKDPPVYRFNTTLSLPGVWLHENKT